MRELTVEEFQDEFPDFPFKKAGEMYDRDCKVVQPLKFFIEDDGAVLHLSQMSAIGEGYGSDNLFRVMDHIGCLPGEAS